MRKYTDKELQTIKEAASKGVPIRRVAKALGRGSGSVYNLANKRGWVKPKQYELSESEKQYARERIAAGDNYAEIGRKLGRGTATIRKYSLDNNLRGPQRFWKAEISLQPIIPAIKRDYESFSYTRPEIAKKYNISLATIQRLAKDHNWLSTRDPNNPNRKAVDRLIKKMYVHDKASTLQISRSLKSRRYPLGDEYVRKRLKDMGIPMRDKGAKNVLRQYYRYKHLPQAGISGPKLTRFIKSNFDQMTLKEAAKETGVDRMSLKRRADALGVRFTRIKKDKLIKLRKAAFEYQNDPKITIKALGDKYDLDPRAISQYLKEKKVKR